MISFNMILVFSKMPKQVLIWDIEKAGSFLPPLSLDVIIVIEDTDI